MKRTLLVLAGVIVLLLIVRLATRRGTEPDTPPTDEVVATGETRAVAGSTAQGSESADEPVPMGPSEPGADTGPDATPMQGPPSSIAPDVPPDAAGEVAPPTDTVDTVASPVGDASGEVPGPPMDGPPPGPPSLASEMNHLMRQVREGGGPPLGEHADAMLASEDPLMRAVGAAMLSATGDLPVDVLQQIASDPDAQVPLMLIGWLEDTGHSEQAVALAEMLRAQGVGAGDIADLIASRTLDSIAARAALDLVRNEYPADELAHLLTETSIDMEQDHIVRMKALLLLRDALSFEDYREEVKLIAENTKGINPLWDESLQRELNRLQGPVEVLDQSPELNTSLVDERLAREYPAMLGDLALYVEYVLEHGDGVVAAGTADTLQGYVEAYRNRPWTGQQQFDLTLLEGMVDDVRALETATSHRARDDHPPF